MPDRFIAERVARPIVNVDSRGMRGYVKLHVQINDGEQVHPSYGRDLITACGMKVALDPMQARHIGERLIQQADMADKIAKEDGGRDAR